MKKILLLLAMVTVSVATWAQEKDGIYRAIEGEEFQEYISKLTKSLFGEKLLLWDDVVDEIEFNTSGLGPTTSETTYFDKKNGLIVKVIRKSSDEIEKDFICDIKNSLPASIVYSNLDEKTLKERWNEMGKFCFAKVEDIPYSLMLYGLMKDRMSYSLIYKDL